MDINRTKSEDWKTLLNSSNSVYSKTYPWKINSKIGIPENTKRNLINALFQLKIDMDTSNPTYTDSESHQTTIVDTEKENPLFTFCLVVIYTNQKEKYSKKITLPLSSP
ncbi:hypothetical protein OCU04_008659 [Sclerotinia nivalis]|uniref:Uncharacterized protein n=1 Tax=Sclerotinia nivalis TaxID=352851 RepID=A0A9X0AIJ2_9HELO|nr:hypothetical protein OCU04_008659 [Sclerotinia nivalis]